jgi:hypothetical protein
MKCLLRFMDDFKIHCCFNYIDIDGRIVDFLSNIE